MQLSGLDANDWFILPDQRVEAAMAFNEVSATGRGGGPSLRRFIDQQRIEVRAAQDTSPVVQGCALYGLVSEQCGFCWPTCTMGVREWRWSTGAVLSMQHKARHAHLMMSN